MKKFALLLVVLLCSSSPLMAADCYINSSSPLTTSPCDAALPILAGSSALSWQIGDIALQFVQPQMRVRVTTRSDVPWSDAAWLARNPRYHDGVIDVIVWRYRYDASAPFDAAHPEVANTRGMYCRALTFQVPAAPGKDVSATLDTGLFRAATATTYDSALVETWPGLEFHIQVGTALLPVGDVSNGRQLFSLLAHSQPYAYQVAATCQ